MGYPGRDISIEGIVDLCALPSRKKVHVRIKIHEVFSAEEEYPLVAVGVLMGIAAKLLGFST